MSNNKSALEAMFDENTLIENPQNFLWNHLLKHHNCADMDRLMEIFTSLGPKLECFADYQFVMEQFWGMYRLSREMQRFQRTGQFFEEMPPLSELC